MSIAGTLINAALDAVSVAFPEAGVAIAIAQKLEPYAEAAIPLIRAAVTEGPAAFQAAKAAAPDLFGHIEQLAAALKGGTDERPVTVSDEEIAHLAAHIAGIDPPGWTHVETQAWWDRASGPAGY